MSEKKTPKKRLITKVITVVCLVATLVAVLVVPSFAYSINENTGSYTSQSFTYTLDRDNPNGYEVDIRECSYFFDAEVIYTFNIPIDEIEGYPNVTYRFDISNGNRISYMSLGTFTSVNDDFSNSFYDQRWGEEDAFAWLSCDYIPEYSFSPESTWNTLQITLVLHADEKDLPSGHLYHGNHKYYGDGGTFRVRFSPTLDDYSTEVKEIIADRNTTIDSLNNTIAEKDKLFYDMIIAKDKTYSDMVAEKDKTISDLNQTIKAKDNTIEQNNGLRQLFNGIGDGIKNLISPFLELEFNGISIGSIVAFVVVVLIVFIVLKFII